MCTQSFKRNFFPFFFVSLFDYDFTIDEDTWKQWTFWKQCYFFLTSVPLVRFRRCPSLVLVCLNIVLKMLFVPGMNLAIPAQICHVLVNLTAGRM